VKNSTNSASNLALRISNSSVDSVMSLRKRWDLPFTKNFLAQNVENLKKVWVCGTPQMNEVFSTIIEEAVKPYNLGKGQYEIM